MSFYPSNSQRNVISLLHFFFAVRKLPSPISSTNTVIGKQWWNGQKKEKKKKRKLLLVIHIKYHISSLHLPFKSCFFYAFEPHSETCQKLNGQNGFFFRSCPLYSSTSAPILSRFVSLATTLFEMTENWSPEIKTIAKRWQIVNSML